MSFFQTIARRCLPAGLVVCCLFASAPLVASDGPTTEGEISNIVQELSQEIESPYCPGKTLAMCPSGGAADVRRDIQQMADRGMSREEIKRELLAQYGDELRLREPPARDHYPLIALIVVGLVVCIGAVAYFARRDDEADTDPPPDPDDEEWSDEDDIYLREIRDQYEA